MVKKIIFLMVVNTIICSFAAEITSGCFTQKGTRHDQNEDRFIIAVSTHPFAGVFDGHGGDLVSHFLQENIHAEFNALFGENQPSDIETKFTNLFLTLDNKVRDLKSGSTAAIAYIETNKRESKAILHTAHVGDSRIVLFDENGNVVYSTSDHKPNREDERVRIEHNDGIIIKNKTTTEYRVFLGEASLNLSRAIGDHYWDPNKKIISSQPEYGKIELKGLQYLIIGSDGLFDVLNNKAIGQLITQNKTQALSGLVQLLIEEAVAKGSRDDITVILEEIKTKS